MAGKLVKLENTFHATETQILVPDNLGPDENPWHWLQNEIHEQQNGGHTWHKNPKAVYLRVCRALCGIDGCTCGIVR